MILLILVSREIGLYYSNSNLKPFLYTGIVLILFKIEGSVLQENIN